MIASWNVSSSSCFFLFVFFWDLRLLVLKLNCFYSMTHWSFLFLDDPWSTGYHYDDHFSSSALCDPQFLCLNSERVVWNKCKFKGAVLSAQLQQTNYSDLGDFRKLMWTNVSVWFCSLWRTFNFTSHSRKSLSVMYVKQKM